MALAKLPGGDNFVGFKGNGIESAAKKGGKLTDIPNGDDYELICNDGKKGGKLTSIPNGDDYALIKKY